MKSFVLTRLAAFHLAAFLLSSVAAAGCGDGSGNAASSGGTTTSGQGGAGGAGGADPMGSGGAGEGGSAGVGGQGGGSAASALVASLSTMQPTMNCQAGVTPSITGTFQAYYDNLQGASTGIAIITKAELTMTLAADSFVWAFTASPSSTPVPAGQSTNANHTIGMGSGSGKGMLCDYCGQIWKLDVDWNVGGKTISGSLGPAPVNCMQ